MALELSVIIVNYQVKFFLEQCLYALQKAVLGIEAEVLVVDNHSTDGSIAYLKPLFPQVRFIENEANLGFAKANNRALALARGQYILFLNPDTLLPEDALHRGLAYLKTHNQAGALGWRMLDGNGHFLPESKRAFPSPLASFYKLTGLAALFPRSGYFNRYALGNLPENQNQSVEVLAGAGMLVRKNILDELKGFDERFFLYGEDIDLSYRIRQAGYENHYFAETPIIHFKGESSGKEGLPATRHFYHAMFLFVQKNQTAGAAKIFSMVLGLGIFLRGLLTVVYKMIHPLLLPLLDGLVMLGCLKGTSLLWIQLVRDGNDFGFPYLNGLLLLMASINILAAWLSGMYHRRPAFPRITVSLVLAWVAMLAAYSLLPESLRFSRGVLLLGGLCGVAAILFLRWLMYLLPGSGLADNGYRIDQLLVVATETEYATINALLEKAMLMEKPLGRVSATGKEATAVCNLDELLLLQKTIPFNSLLFCEGGLPMSAIIRYVQAYSGKGIRFLFHLSQSQTLIGSINRKTAGQVISSLVDYRIAMPHLQRMKRVMDVCMALLLLLTAPLHLLIHARGSQVLKNAIAVLSGGKTWVGYGSSAAFLPPLKPAVIANGSGLPRHSLELADKLYAKNYEWWQDMVILTRNYPKLG